MRLDVPFTRDDLEACLQFAERGLHVTDMGAPDELDALLEPVRLAGTEAQRTDAVAAVQVWADGQVWPLP